MSGDEEEGVWDGAVIPRFEIAPTVVFRLGEELISDVIQALVELVKNSYDADATWVVVKINTPIDDVRSDFPDAGTIEVEDNGHGMTASDFQRGWLLIADSAKRRMKDRKETTKKGRTPVGDKGLGRLGVQRLGNRVTITSRPPGQESSEVYLSFCWDEFLSVDKLSDVPVTFRQQPRSRRRSGTRIVIEGLKDPEQWRGSDARRQLQRRLSELISPFREVRDFSVTVTLDGEEVPIVEVAERLREAASVRYKIEFDGEVLTVQGKARLTYVMRQQRKETAETLRKLVAEDMGRSFYDFLVDGGARGKPPLFDFVGDSVWFAEFRFRQSLSELGGAKYSNGKLANPGPFHGEVDYLLDVTRDAEDSIWDRNSDLRSLLRNLAGIRVYRNGFGIRVGDDWLNLGSQQTQAQSMYGLRPKNVLGYISIDAEKNKALTETTSREGFQDTPHYQNFYALLRRLVSWSEQAQGFMRRGANAFVKAHQEAQAGLEPASNTEDVVDYLKKHAKGIDRGHEALMNAKAEVAAVRSEARARFQPANRRNVQLSLYQQDKLDELDGLVQQMEAVLAKVDAQLEEYSSEAKAANQAQRILDVILEREERLKSELEMVYGGVALGLTAEALAHEISTVADRLAKESARIRRHLSGEQQGNERFERFVEYVRSAVQALRKQVAHLDPSLKYVRDARVELDLVEQVSQAVEFYSERLRKNGISINVEAEASFCIKISKGKVNQVLDNLILNSEYWLKDHIRQHPQVRPLITIKVDRPVLLFYDSGPGVAEAVEDTLFDPFVTAKGQGGRGLGLFIIQQLLDTERCGITLLPERNRYGRRYIFEVDFGGAAK